MFQFLFGIFLIVAVIDFAKADILRVECHPTDKPEVTRIVEINTMEEEVRYWVKFPSRTNGPNGPYDAIITPLKITWMDVNKVGRAQGVTKYMIDRQRHTLTIEIEHNWQEDVWRETSPCK